MRGNQDPPSRTQAPVPKDSAPGECRCKRCGKVLDSRDRETYFERTGMCFWCAYVDSQG